MGRCTWEQSMAQEGSWKALRGLSSAQPCHHLESSWSLQLVVYLCMWKHNRVDIRPGLSKCPVYTGLTTRLDRHVHCAMGSVLPRGRPSAFPGSQNVLASLYFDKSSGMRFQPPAGEAGLPGIVHQGRADWANQGGIGWVKENTCEFVSKSMLCYHTYLWKISL